MQTCAVRRVWDAECVPAAWKWMAAGALLALAACGGGGGGGKPAAPAGNITPSALSLDGDNATLQAYADTVGADGNVAVDPVQLTLLAPAQPELTRQIASRSWFKLRGLATSDPLTPQPYSQLVWTSQGHLYRMSARDGVNAPLVQVSGLNTICTAQPVGRMEREDVWILVMLANDQGGCGPDTSTNRQKLLKLTAGSQDMGVALGLWSEISVLAPLHHTDGSPGPILVVNHPSGSLDIVDPTGSGALNTHGTDFKPVQVVDDTLPLHYAAAPQVSSQHGVLQANGKVTVVDWSGGKISFRDSVSTAGTSDHLALKGRFGDGYLLTTEADAWSLSTAGVAQLLHRYAANVTGSYAGWASSTQADVQPSCAVLSQMVKNPSTGQSKPIDPYALRPSPASALPLLPPTPGFMPNATDGLSWLVAKGDVLPSLVRVHCDTGQTKLSVSQATPLAPVNWFGPQGRQGWWPHVKPPSAQAYAVHAFPSGKQAILSGAQLAAYAPSTDTEVDYGTLPDLPGEYIVNIWPRQGAQASTDSLLFDVLTTDDQGVRHGALIGVRPQTAGSIHLIKAGLPIPVSTAEQ